MTLRAWSIPLDEKTFRNISTLTFVTRFGPFDILFDPAGAPQYEDLAENAVVMERFGIEVAVASVGDLISMKRAAGREKDAAHLTVLVEFTKTQGEGGGAKL